jgi:hypothetical protein
MSLALKRNKSKRRWNSSCKAQEKQKHIKMQNRKSISKQRQQIRNQVLSRKELLDRLKLSQANQIEMR